LLTSLEQRVESLDQQLVQLLQTLHLQLPQALTMLVLVINLPSPQLQQQLLLTQILQEQ